MATKASASSTPKRKLSKPTPNLKAPLLSLEQDISLDSSIYDQYMVEKQQIKDLLKQVSDAKKKALESESESEEDDEDEDEFQISFKQDEDEEQFDNNLVSEEELAGDNVFQMEEDDVIDLGQDSDIDQGFETDNDADLSRLEDVQELISETSTAFDRVVKHTMTKQGYQGQTVASDRPSTLSAPATKAVPLSRFPTNPYVARKLHLMRDALKFNPTSTSTSGKKSLQIFFKPPAFLSRVAEVGDPVKNSEAVKAPLKSVSTTPEEWNDILSELKVSEAKSLGKAFLQAPETRNMELASTWGTKVLNYVDHFANPAQSLQAETSAQMKVVKEYVKSMSTNEDGSSALPTSVSNALAKMDSKHADSIFCIQEMANLIPHAMDTTIYTQAMLEIHRRDDLLSVINPNLSSNLIRELRLSPFGSTKVFDPTICAKAAKYIARKVKNGDIIPGNRDRGRHGRNKRGGRGGSRGSSGNRRNFRQQKSYQGPNRADNSYNKQSSTPSASRGAPAPRQNRGRGKKQ